MTKKNAHALRIADVQLWNQYRQVESAITASSTAFAAAVAHAAETPSAELPTAELAVHIGVLRTCADTTRRYRRLPYVRRQWLQDAQDTAETLAKRVYLSLPDLAGTETYYGALAETTSIAAHTEPGERYRGRAAQYRKNNGRVRVLLGVADAETLLQHAPIVAACYQDNLPLVRIEQTTSDAHLYRCDWVAMSRGYSVRIQSGWIAVSAVRDGSNDVPVVFHSVRSPNHAAQGLQRKLAAKAGFASLANVPFLTRRLIRNTTGWCGPGVQAWIDRFLPAYSRLRSVPRDVVLEAARADDGHYGQQLVKLLSPTGT